MPAAAFRLFGFPVHVRPGFLMFMVLVVMLNGATFGIALAAFLAVFTLIHELGHAFSARATGAKAEIALDFLAGYASFVPTRPLKPWERVGISFAGPAAQIVSGTLVYLAVGGRGWLPETGHPVQYGAWLAGPVIGLFNLIPILPFDGGNILQVGVEVITPKHARNVMYAFTIAVAAGGIVYLMMQPRLRPFVFFIAIPLVTVAQSITSEREHTRRTANRHAAAKAEARAWATGTVSGFPPDRVPSPWFRAWQQVRSGEPVVARQLILTDMYDEGPVDWWPPESAPPPALAEVLAVIPRPLPVGRAFSCTVLSGVLLAVGAYDEAGAYAAAAYQVHRAPMLAVHVARAAAALGDRSLAVAWLNTAARDADPDSLRLAVMRAPELATLRHDS